MQTPKLVLLVTLAIAGWSSIIVADPQGEPPPSYQPIPEPTPETIPAPPQGAYIWRPGHWIWNGYRYRWIRGAYVLRGPRMHEWVPGAWVMRGGAWVWVQPHWR
jgi:hypothetical protein